MAKYPRQDEIVIGKVKKILPYGAFLTLQEYGDAEAFMHVSEVAPRWIKNIHEFLSENQVVVVRVHHLDTEKGQIDVSLKRVNEDEKKRKLERVRKNTRAEKLLDHALKNAKSKKTPESLREEVLAQYDTLYDFLEDVRDSGDSAFEGIDVKGALKDEIVALAGKYVKKSEVEVARIITLKCFEPNGVQVIRETLGHTGAHYLGPGRYRLKMTAEDYKVANKAIDKIVKSIEAGLKGKDCEFSVAEEKR